MREWWEEQQGEDHGETRRKQWAAWGLAHDEILEIEVSMHNEGLKYHLKESLQEEEWVEMRVRKNEYEEFMAWKARETPEGYKRGEGEKEESLQASGEGAESGRNLLREGDENLNVRVGRGTEWGPQEGGEGGGYERKGTPDAEWPRRTRRL